MLKIILCLDGSHERTQNFEGKRERGEYLLEVKSVVGHHLDL
jgi:hypothetical protein